MASSYQVPSTLGGREKKLSTLRNKPDWKTLHSFHSVWEESVVSFLIARGAQDMIIPLFSAIGQEWLRP